MAVPALAYWWRPAKPRARQVEQPVLVLVDQAAVLGMGDPVAVADEQTGAPRRGGFALDHVERRLGSAARRSTGRPRLMMPAFSRGDAGERVAEELLVVDRDRGDHRDERLGDDVGGVERPPRPTSSRSDVGRVVGEQHEGGGGGDLELR